MYKGRQMTNKVGTRIAAAMRSGIFTKIHCGSRYVVLYLGLKSALLAAGHRNGEGRRREGGIGRSPEVQG